MPKRSWLSYRLGKLGQNALLGTMGLGTRAVIQAGYLWVVSRWLGAEDYGWFSGAVALVILAAPLANWGSGYLIPRYIARDRSISRGVWATALMQTGIMGGLLSLGMLLFAIMLPKQPLPWEALLLLALSELVLLPATHAATSQCYALERGIASAISMCLVPFGRFAWMLGLMGLGVNASPENAVWAHFVGSASGVTAAIVLVAYIDGWPRWQARIGFLKATREGGSYALSHAAGTSYQEVDKILMLQIIGAAAVGTYSVAFRASSIFVLPIYALVGASLPRLMRLFESGKDTAETFQGVFWAALAYGLLAGIAMLIAAPLMPLVFGKEYEDTSQILAWLSPWPILFSIRQLLATYLTACGQQHARAVIDFTGIVTAVFFNIFFLPKMGELGAVVSLLITELIVSFALFCTMQIIQRNKL